MKIELKPANKLTYKLRLTSQMKLAINLLQMPLIELKNYIQQQVEENPLLDISPDKNTIGNIENSKISNDINYNSDEDEEKQDYRESLLTKPVTLFEHLIKQLHLFVNSEDERETGEIIIANIDDNGYLKPSIEEIAAIAQTTTSQIQKILSLIQTFDPIGVGARDLRECLLLQIRAKSRENSLAGRIIDKYLPYLEKKRFEFIAEKLSAGNEKITAEKIKEAIKEIACLEPKPGRSFDTERTVHLIPDVILNPVRSKPPETASSSSAETSNGVKINNNDYEVILNDWELPALNLNPKYKRMLQQKDVSEDTKEYLKERLEAAKFLINAINKRKETIKSVTEAICYLQKDFLDNGMQNLKPMTLSQIADLVDKHKSTVSRTVNNKYLQTPDGIFELHHFFNSGIKQENGGLCSSKAVKSKIKGLIENENKENPLSDQEIVNLLKQDGTVVSRRAIAKYRRQLKILSSRSRKQ
ncbi:MAG: RNA polymerase sigma-54 factor [Candidatus Omnitrophota bacterium]